MPWRFGRRSDSKETSITLTAEMLNGRTGGFIRVVGESQYQDAIKDVVKDLLRDGDRYETTAVLTGEPNNPHDANAIAVYLEGGGMVGYLPRDEALAYQPLLQRLAKQKKVAACRALIFGGTKDKPSWGVFLDLADPDVTLDG